eukprot:UN13638
MIESETSVSYVFYIPTNNVYIVLYRNNGVHRPTNTNPLYIL